jgi:hypothetical protein
MNIYDSAGSQIDLALKDITPIEAWVGMIGGKICVVFGIIKAK